MDPLGTGSSMGTVMWQESVPNESTQHRNLKMAMLICLIFSVRAAREKN
jgi:hypothetical protein